ncbi:MAG: hypothetical protein KBH45_06380 [Verrucomicrobia bacterium]|nr:hypothetical protein [Verrucomicrobiota bacterium]
MEFQTVVQPLLKLPRAGCDIWTTTERSKRSDVVVNQIKPVIPAKGNDPHRMGSLPRILVCVALAMLISSIPCRSEILSTPTKLSLIPLPAPTATTTNTDHFALAFEPQSNTLPATAGTGDATRRILAAAACLNKHSTAASGLLASIFSAQEGDRGFRIANLQAGYGMVCMDPVFTRGRNGTAMEEPSFFFLKTSLKF